MKLNKSFKIWKACSTDATRHVINQVQLEGNQCIATTGNIMAIAPVMERNEHDTDGMIEGKFIEKASKQIGKRADYVEVLANGSQKFTAKDGSVVESQRPEGSFPNWRQVVPSAEQVFSIAFNAQKLADLAEAIGAENGEVRINLTVDANGVPQIESAFTVQCANKDNGAVGIIMPVRIK